MKLIFRHVSCKIILLTLTLLGVVVTGYELQNAHYLREVPSTVQCPSSCQCTIKDNYLKTVRIACRDRELSGLELPAGTTSVDFVNVTAVDLKSLNLNPDTIELVYRSSGLHHLGLKVFSGLTKLEVLDLADNGIESIQPETLSKLNNLKRLNLTSNTIHHFSSELFKACTLLKELLVAHNHLHIPQPKVFAPLVSLQRLDLSYNQITSTIDRFTNKDLVNLSLSHNSIRDIYARTFADLSNLQTLDLSYNALEILPDDLFQKTYELEYLDLTNNLIRSLSNRLFFSLKKIKYLGLKDNNIDHIPDGLFASNLELEVLNLQGNNIQLFAAKQVIGLGNLKELNLKDNKKLNSIDMPSKQLQRIDLSSNNLTRPPEFLTDLSTSDLQSVNLRDNPWVCDCQMKWFVDWSKQLHGVLDDSQTCDELESADCLKPESSRNKTIQLIEMRSNATIDCNIEGNPYPSITWVTPTGLVLHYNAPDNPIFTDHPLIHNQDRSTTDIDNRVKIIDKGILYINYVMRIDAGQYVCFASNPLANLTVFITVHLDRDTFYDFKLTSIMIGISCAAGFLLMTAIGHLIVFIFKKCGWTCCCISEDLPRVKQFYQMMEGLEIYKTQQLDRLRDNYAQQVHKIKDNCAEQVDWIRDSYQGQVQHLRDIRDYGTTHLSSIRDQYLDQMKKVRDYSTGQLSWVRENYVFQRNRIRKFSTHQVLRFRETYKYQQQTLNKILENLPSLYLDNCRSGSCGHSDSNVEGFDEPEIAGIDIYIKKKINSLTKPSQLDDSADDQSVYYTPSELSESPRSPNGFNQFPKIPSEDEEDGSSTASLRQNYCMPPFLRQENEIPPALSRRIFSHRSAFVPIRPEDPPASSSRDMTAAEESFMLLMPSSSRAESSSTPWLGAVRRVDASPCQVFKYAADSTSKDCIKPSTSLPTLSTRPEVNENIGDTIKDNESCKNSTKTLSLETSL